MNLWLHAPFVGSFEDSCCLRRSEETYIAEYVNEVSEFLFSHFWNHFIDYEVNVISLCEPSSHGMSSEECRFNAQRSVFLETTYHAKHLQFVFGSETVATLYLYASRSLQHYFLSTMLCSTIEFILRKSMKQVSRIEDSSSTLCYFSIAESADLIHEFRFATSGKDDMSMRITP